LVRVEAFPKIIEILMSIIRFVKSKYPGLVILNGIVIFILLGFVMSKLALAGPAGILIFSLTFPRIITADRAPKIDTTVIDKVSNPKNILTIHLKTLEGLIFIKFTFYLEIKLVSIT